MLLYANSAAKRWRFPFNTAYAYGHQYLSGSTRIRGVRTTSSYPDVSRITYPVVRTANSTGRTVRGIVGSYLRA